MKSVKADRKLIQRLLNAVTAGWPVEMDSIMKHDSPVVWRGYYVKVLSIRFFDGTVF